MSKPKTNSTSLGKFILDLQSDIRAFDEEMNELYNIVFGTLVKILGFVAFLAILISCLGLLGMATYTVETRKKEIAVRKVLEVATAPW